MITSLSLKNFKSFKTLDNMMLFPITIFCGQNSSGKSTILQSLLLFKQTAESPFSDDPILLNGSYVSLGEYSDIVYFNTQPNSNLEFSFSFSFPEENENKMIDFLSTLNWEKINLKSITYKVSLAINDIRTDLHLNKVHLNGIIKDTSFELMMSSGDLFTLLKEKYTIQDIFKDFFSSERLLRVDSSQNIIPKPVAVTFDNFLPEYYWVATNNNLKRTVDGLRGKILSYLSVGVSIKTPMRNLNRVLYLKYRAKGPQHSPDHEASLKNLEKSIISYNKFLSNTDISDTLEQGLQIITTLQHFLSVEQIKGLQDIIDDEFRNITAIINDKKELMPGVISELKIENSSSLEDINNSLKSCFKRLFYLGPLREEPKVFYRRIGSTDPMYVGQKGENTAFVLKYYFHKPIATILPPRDSTLGWNPYKSEVVQSTLGEAVKRWLNYLGVASDVRVDEMGKVGLRIMTNIFGEKETDLLNVGVGVSQILPIIVLGLASPHHSILLFEQPELHLHPYVQSRLADFFISLLPLDKQVLAETHSEHIIHRMRFHIAKENINFNNDIGVYFIKWDKEKKCSIDEKVNIDSLGSIVNWPDNFFDETQKVLKDILDTGFEKGLKDI